MAVGRRLGFSLSGRRLALALFASFAAATAVGATRSELEAVINAPLLSADPAKPIEIIAANWWVITDGVSEDLKGRIDPEHQGKTGDSLPVGSFVVDGDKGPVTLVVDYAASVKALTGSDGSVRIGIECMNQPMKCGIPGNKSVLMYHADLMSRMLIPLKDSAAAFAIGRDAYSYRLPADETVRVDVTVGKPHNLDPLFLKAWLIYGENAADVVPGQTSQSSAIKWWIGGGIGVLILLMRRLVGR
jgi:hypothetical protein